MIRSTSMKLSVMKPSVEMKPSAVVAKPSAMVKPSTIVAKPSAVGVKPVAGPVSQAPIQSAVKQTPAIAAQEAEDKILFQDFFKSVGPRTYASQLKEAKNGNHYLVITEGKRDKESGEVRKTRVFVFSEDFSSFFRMLHNTAQFIREHPVSDEVKKKRAKYWAKHGSDTPAPAGPAPIAPVKANGSKAAPAIARTTPRTIVRAKK